MSNAALELRDVVRSYGEGHAKIKVLRGIDLAIQPGELVALIAPSGAGKSTLLHIAGLLEAPNAGEVLIEGTPTRTLNDKKRTLLRCRTIGFIYQFHHLLPEFTALENVMMPQFLAGMPREQAQARATLHLEKLGLGARLTHRPAELSGGEQQRVAIARAMANGPALLLADEPTGNLDPHTSLKVFDELLAATREAGLAALIATHNLDLAARMDRQLTLKDGKITSTLI